MIRTFTIVENMRENGNAEYAINGDLPIDEAAKALVIIALHTELPKTKQKKEEISLPSKSDAQTDPGTG